MSLFMNNPCKCEGLNPNCRFCSGFGFIQPEEPEVPSGTVVYSPEKSTTWDLNSARSSAEFYRREIESLASTECPLALTQAMDRLVRSEKTYAKAVRRLAKAGRELIRTEPTDRERVKVVVDIERLSRKYLSEMAQELHEARKRLGLEYQKCEYKNRELRR